MRLRRLATIAFSVAVLINGFTPLPGFRGAAIATTANPLRISVASDGTQANGASWSSVVSDDGTQVAFASSASNLVSGDTNGSGDIFVRDLRSGTTIRESVASDGTQGNGVGTNQDVHSVDMTSDGRFLAFSSRSSNLVASDTNSQSDIFVRDRDADGNGVFDEAGSGKESTVLISTATSGTLSNGPSNNARISANGRYVTFDSSGTNLVPSDTNGTVDVFVRDRDTDSDGVFDESGSTSTYRVSQTSGGTGGNGVSSTPAISADGLYVAFETAATNLVTPDTGGWADVLRRDGASGQFIRASQNSSGTQATGGPNAYAALSADGRVVAFTSRGTNLISPNGAGTSEAFAWANGNVELLTQSTAGDLQTSGAAITPSVSQTGRYVLYSSSATNLVASDTNGRNDVFLRDRVLKTTSRVSVGAGGTQATGGNSSADHISRSGRYVVYTSSATNLVSGDTNAQPDIFLYDRGQSVPLERTYGFGLNLDGVDAWNYWADPINTATGAFSHAETDISLPGIGLPFAFTRTYTSADATGGPLGSGWIHNFLPSLTIQTDIITFREGGIL